MPPGEENLDCGTVPARLRILSALIITLVFVSCAVVPYALSDEYGQLLYLLNGWCDWTTDCLAIDGRPLASFLVSFGIMAAGDIAHLCILRGVALLGAVLAGDYLLWRGVRIGLSRNVALATTLITVLAPGMGEYVGWSVSWPYPFLILCVLFLAFRLEDEMGRGSRRIAAAVVLLLAAMQAILLTYQPVAGYFILPGVLFLARGKSAPLLRALPILALSFAFYRFASYPLVHHFFPTMCRTTRAMIDSDLAGHLSAVFTRFLPYVGASWGNLLLPEDAAWLFGIAACACALCGAACILRRFAGRMRVAAALLLAGAFALSAPQVFLLGDIWAFRTHVPMSVLTVLLAFFGLLCLAGRRDRAVTPVFLGILVLSAAWCFNAGLVWSARREYAIVKHALEDLRQSGAKSACVLVTPDSFDPQPPVPVYWHSCYGIISLISMNGIEPALVMQELCPDAAERPVLLSVKADRPQDVPEGMPVLDLWGEVTGKPSPASFRARRQ